MTQHLVGYSRIIETYALRARTPAVSSCIDTSAKMRHETVRADQILQIFEPKYAPGEGLMDQLEFSLRYEGVNLEVLALLFKNEGKNEIENWLEAKPKSKYARKIGFLYEFLTGQTLDFTPLPQKMRYEPLLDPEQYVVGPAIRNSRFSLHVNLLGEAAFCPTIRRTKYLEAQQQKDLRALTAKTLAQYDKSLLDRAAAFLYLKETHSSFNIEREKPSASRAERFAQLLAAASDMKTLTKDELVRLQNAIIDGRFAEFWFRTKQNWVGRDIGSYYKRVDFTPPRPEDVEPLIDGLLAFTNRYTNENASADDISIAACAAFGFVFIHPFMDGNGRLHRFLIHQMLSARGFTPRGIILPVSAVMLANLNEYVSALEAFSKPLQSLVHFDPNTPDIPAQGNDAIYYRYFDATPQVEFLYAALERTVTHDLEEQIHFLIHYDAAYARLNEIFDWPKGRLDLFIRVLAENNGELSARKHKSHFEFLTDEEIERFEEEFAKAFELSK